ncbi:hypothetical protein V8E36_007274 [Tilletia maclaganii]
MEHVAVVGAGPVGSLTAIALAERGCRVDLYERQQQHHDGHRSGGGAGNTRSINLAISTRALTALAALTPSAAGSSSSKLGLADEVLAQGIPMRARMIHHMPTAPAPTVDRSSVRRVHLSADSTVSPSPSAAPLPTTQAIERSTSVASFDCVAPSPAIEKPNDFYDDRNAHASSSKPTHSAATNANGATRRRPSLADQELDVALDSQDYGIDRSVHRIYSVDRSKLSAMLLARAEAHPNVRVIWGHSLSRVRFLDDDSAEDGANGVELEFECQSAAGEEGKATRIYAADMVIGCDGMHSPVRRALDAYQPLGVEQAYIDCAYLELHIPAPPPLSDGAPGPWPLSPDHLHIWPRHSFMLIALPNADRSFTCTLFAPYALFGAAPPPSAQHGGSATASQPANPLANALSMPQGTLAFFQTYFPDALELMGSAHVIEAVSARSARPGRLGSVTLRRGVYHEVGGGRAVLLGDAAHAMVPFYGQGLNCGLEDVRLLIETLEAEGGLPLQSANQPGSRRSSKLAEALGVYSRTRHPALCAILQLAQQNYEEMSHRVVSRTYLARKWLDGMLMRLMASWPSSAASPLSTIATRQEFVQAETETEESGSGSSHEGSQADAAGLRRRKLSKTSISSARLDSWLRSALGSCLSQLSSATSTTIRLASSSSGASTPPLKPTASRGRSARAPRHPTEAALGAWKSLYTMVTFTNMPYDAVVRQAKRQDRLVSGVGLGLGLVAAWGLGRIGIIAVARIHSLTAACMA